MKRMITRSITAPMVYMEGKAEGIHIPGTTLSGAKSMAEKLMEGKVSKVIMETVIYELEEELFLQYAHIKPKKEAK